MNKLYGELKNWHQVAEELKGDANKFRLYCKFCQPICSEWKLRGCSMSHLQHIFISCYNSN